jgi:hypothetical protein
VRELYLVVAGLILQKLDDPVRGVLKRILRLFCQINWHVALPGYSDAERSRAPILATTDLLLRQPVGLSEPRSIKSFMIDRPQ